MEIILDQNPGGQEGEPEGQKPSESDTDKGTSGENGKDVADEGSGKDEKPKPEDQKKPDSATAPETSEDKKGENEEDDQGISDDDLRRASARVASDHRRIKRENVGLQGQIDSMQKDAEEAPELRDKVSKLERENMILRLAGKHGLDPALLEPIHGSEEDIEKWIQKYTVPPEGAAATVSSSDGKTKPDESGEGEGDKKPKEPEIPDVDKGRPMPKDEGKTPDFSTMTNAEKAEYWRKRI